MIEILLAEGADPELADAYGRDCYECLRHRLVG